MQNSLSEKYGKFNFGFDEKNYHTRSKKKNNFGAN